MTPTRDAVAALVARLRDVDRGLADRIVAHLEREKRAGASIRADGYPSATMGGSGTSGSGLDVTTSVESAAITNVEGTTPRDDHRAHSHGALRCLQRSVVALDECMGHLRALDQLDKIDDPTDGDCTHHASFARKAPSGPSRASKERGLCDYCAGFADAHEGRRPPEVILERIAQGKRPTPQQVAHALGESFGVTALGAKLMARLTR
jgi:hypothetical protein